jgi:hypothetical protein
VPVSWLNDMIGLTLPVTDGFDQRQLGPKLPVVIVSANFGFDEDRKFLDREPSPKFHSSSLLSSGRIIVLLED